MSLHLASQEKEYNILIIISDNVSISEEKIDPVSRRNRTVEKLHYSSNKTYYFEKGMKKKKVNKIISNYVCLFPYHEN